MGSGTTISGKKEMDGADVLNGTLSWIHQIWVLTEEGGRKKAKNRQGGRLERE